MRPYNICGIEVKHFIIYLVTAGTRLVGPVRRYITMSPH